MSKTSETLKRRSEGKRKQAQQQKDEIGRIREESLYRAALVVQLTEIRRELAQPNVASVEVQVPQNYLVDFARSMQTGEMGDFDITQVDFDRFKIAERVIYM